MNGQIVCRLKGGAKLTFNVPHREAVVGRDPGLEVAVPADGVSRRHAKISWDGGSYWIEDLKSTNGTFVNGMDVAREGKERLRHLDVISLGREIDLLFLVRDAPAQTVTRIGIVAAQLIPFVPWTGFDHRGRRVTSQEESGDTPPRDIGVGELSLGRSAANNIVIDSSAISKMHAKIQRTTEHVILQDLGSSNGTFVNGARVMTALLQDGDTVSLGGVASYRVQIETGEVKALAGPRPAAPRPSADKPEFEADWKTRYEWDSGEYADLMALRQDIAAREAGEVSGKKQSTSKLPAVKATGKTAPAPSTAKGEPAQAAAPSAPAKAAATPAPPVSRAAPTGPAPVARPASTPSAPKPAAAPPKPAPAPENLAPTARAVAKVRLIGPGVDLNVTTPGTYEIGRLSEVQLRIVHPTVSRRQARLTLTVDRLSVRLEHIGSSPTLVNGRVLNESTSLVEGDQVQFGEVSLTVKLE